VSRTFGSLIPANVHFLLHGNPLAEPQLPQQWVAIANFPLSWTVAADYVYGGAWINGHGIMFMYLWASLL